MHEEHWHLTDFDHEKINSECLLDGLLNFLYRDLWVLQLLSDMHPNKVQV